jgi:hypothetical protein
MSLYGLRRFAPQRERILEIKIRAKLTGAYD